MRATWVGRSRANGAEELRARRWCLWPRNRRGRGLGGFDCCRLRMPRRRAWRPPCIGPWSLAARICSDGWRGYGGLPEAGYQHHVVRSEGEVGDNLLPRCHRVASLLKRWLLGTHQGAVSHRHLAYYLHEFTFRFNRRTSLSRGKLFYRLIQQAVQIDPHPYAKLVRPQSIGAG